MRVKICGVTTLEDARVAAECGAWAIGFNFYRRSPRYIDPSAAVAIRQQLPPQLAVAGVFVDAGRSEIEAVASEVGLSVVQFHGAEPPELCRGWSVTTIKAIRVRDHDCVRAAASYDVDFILADAYVEGALGGTGRQLDPNLLGGFDRSRLLLAGGLNPDNVAQAIRLVRPSGVDVASGVELRPGRKDPALIRRFVENALSA